jgi:hypothetical protein
LSWFDRDEWNLGIIPQSIESIARNGIQQPIRWFPTNSWRILADPYCIVNADGSITILAERLNHWVGKGKIYQIVVQHGDPQIAHFSSLFSITPHLSYPHVIKDGLDMYLTVESHEINNALLWRLQTDNLWQFEKVLLPCPAIDPTVYYDGRLWWLFCGLADHPNDKLYLFYAPSLLSKWIAHPLNPVKVDRGNARPAGSLFAVDGKLIRPAQDSSQTYGGRLILNQITTLTTEIFTEIPYRILAPSDDYYCDGLHTIAAAGDYTVIDGKRWHRGIGSIGCRISAKLFKLRRRHAIRSLVVDRIL